MTLTREPATPGITAPLRDEHAELLPHVEALHATADAVNKTNDDLLLEQVERAYAFLHGHLIVHASAEESALYPVIEQHIGGGATATMSRDHVEIGRLTDELAVARDRLAAVGLSPGLAAELRRLLYGLHAVVRLHFAKEEEVYLPILDATLTTEAAEELFSAMHRAALAAAR